MPLTFADVVREGYGFGSILRAIERLILMRSPVLPNTYEANFEGITRALWDLGTVLSGDIPPSGEITSGLYPPNWSTVTNDYVTGGEPRDGWLWFDQRQGRLFVADGGEWFQANGAESLLHIGPDEPARRLPGTSWFDTRQGVTLAWIDAVTANGEEGWYQTNGEPLVLQEVDKLVYDSGATPSLDLRFATTKSLVDATTGNNLVTFTRGSSGTYVGSDGLIKTAATNEPRFTHDPVTGESLGLLVEEQRVNLLQRTEEFNNIAWLVFGSTAIAANEAISPRGTSTADVVTVSGSGAGIYQNAAVTPGASYTASVYVRLGTLPPVDYKIAFYDNTTSSFIAQDITPNQLVTTSRWVRISHTIQAPAGCTSLRFYPFRNSASVSGSLYLWGAQLEAGTFPTSYIENVDNPLGATRAADVVSIDGVNFSSWYNASEGTVFSEARSSSGASYTSYVYSIGSNFNEAILHYRQADFQPVARVRKSGVDEFGAAGAGPIWTGTDLNRSALALSSTSGRFASDGLLASGADDTSIALPSVTSMTIGSLSSASPINGTIKRITYWPSRLPNSVLQAITL